MACYVKCFLINRYYIFKKFYKLNKLDIWRYIVKEIYFCYNLKKHHGLVIGDKYEYYIVFCKIKLDK